MKFQFVPPFPIANTSALQLENIQSQKFDTLAGYDPIRSMASQIGWPIKPYLLTYKQPYQLEQKKDYEFERMKFAVEKDVGKQAVQTPEGETGSYEGATDRASNRSSNFMRV